MSMLEIAQHRRVVRRHGDTGVRPVAGKGARRMSRAGMLLVGCGVVLVPWLVVLAVTVPATFTAGHWAVAWVGLDSMEAVGLVVTGLLTLRRDPRSALTAAVTGTLLVVDAWFDILTSASNGRLLVALAMAVCVELPLGVLCAHIALRGTVASQRPRTGRSPRPGR